MQRLDEGLSANHTGNALLYTICALGAKYAGPCPLSSKLDYEANVNN